MQDRYTGDLGDFGKYGLLKALCRRDGLTPSLSLGVVWYLTAPEIDRPADGKHVRYLLKPTPRDISQLRTCDPAVYDALAGIVRSSDRRVARIRECGVLPNGTAFHEDVLTFDGMSAHGAAARKARLAHREKWVADASSRTASCDIVFFDPDNGLEVGVKEYHKRGPKYVFFNELEPYRNRGQSLVVYQHLGHEDPHEQMRRRVSQIRERLECEDVLTLWYHRGTSRVFFLIPATAHRRELLKRAEGLVQGLWGKHKHFELCVLGA